jgi:F-box protein 9
MEDNAELESFRRQWREEVSRKTQTTNAPGPSRTTPNRAAIAQPQQYPPTRHEASARKDDEDEEGPASYDQNEIVQGLDRLSLAKPEEEDVFHSRKPRAEPRSALEHFERAVEREAEGNLGDSLQHYRKAYRVSRDRSYITRTVDSIC